MCLIRNYSYKNFKTTDDKNVYFYNDYKRNAMDLLSVLYIYNRERGK